MIGALLPSKIHQVTGRRAGQCNTNTRTQSPPPHVRAHILPEQKTHMHTKYCTLIMLLLIHWSYKDKKCRTNTFISNTAELDS